MTQSNKALWTDFRENPADPAVFSSLRRALKADGDMPGLVELFADRAQAVGGQESVCLHLAIAEGLEGANGDPARTEAAYRAAFESAGQLPNALNTLREVFWQRGLWVQLDWILDHEARTARTREERAAAYLEAARFKTVKLGDPVGAASAYVRAVRESQLVADTARLELTDLCREHPDSEPLARALGELARSQGRYEDLAEMLRLRLTLLPRDQGDVRTAVLFDLADVRGNHLGDRDRAVEVLREAIAAAPDRVDEARSIAREMLAGSPGAMGLIGFLEQLAYDQQDWDAALEMIHMRARGVADTNVKGDILWRAGEILWDQVGDHQRALEEFEAACAADPRRIPRLIERFDEIIGETADERAAAALLARQEQLLKAAGQTDQLVKVWIERLSTEDEPAARLDLLCRIGDAHRDELRQPERSFHFYQQGAELADDVAIERAGLDRLTSSLFGLLQRDVLGMSVEKLLDRIARKHERWTDLLNLLTLRLERAEGDAEVARVNDALGDLLLNRFDQTEVALDHFQRAVATAPQEADYLMHAEEAAGRLERWQESLQYLDRRLLLTQGAEAIADLLRRRAEILWDRLGQPEAGVETLLQAVNRGDLAAPFNDYVRGRLAAGEGPSAVTAILGRMPQLALAAVRLLPSERLDALESGELDLALTLDQATEPPFAVQQGLEKSLLRAQRFEDLADTLERHAQRLAPGPERIAALSNLVVLVRHQLADSERALNAYWLKVREAPQNWAIVQELLDYLKELDRPEDLAGAYQWTLAQLDDQKKHPQKAAALADYAALLDERLERPDLASQPYYELLGLSPLHGEALAFFRRYYGHAEDTYKLYQVLGQTVGSIANPAAKAERLLELGQLADRVGERDKSEAYLQAAVDTDEADRATRTSALDLLCEGFRRAGTPDRLVVALKLRASVEDAVPEKTALLLEVADLLAEHAAPEDELAILDELLELRPDDTDLWERAADTALQADDPGREAAFTRGLLKSAPTRRDARMRLARILVDQLQALDEGLDELRLLLAETPGDPTTLDLIQEAFLHLERPGELHQLLLDQAEVCDGEARRAVLMRVADGGAFVEEDGEDWTAWALEQLFADSPDDQQIGRRLARHFEDGNQWDDAAGVVRRLIDGSQADGERVELLRQLGSIQEHRLDDVAGAQATYQRIAELAPENVGPYRAMLRISKKTGEFPAIPRLTGEILALDPKADDLAALVHDAAAVASEELEDDDTAIGLLSRLVELDPFNRESLERLSGLFQKQARWGELSDSLDRLSGLAEGDAGRIELWSRRARVLEEEVGSLDEAADVYRDILRINPGNRLALHALKRLYSAQGRWQDVLAVLHRLTQLDTDPTIQAATLRDAADVYENGLDEPVKAMDLHRRCHDMAPGETVSLEAMARLAENHDMWEPYVAVLLSDIQRATSPEALLGQLLGAAKVIETKLEEPDAAFDLLFSHIEPQPRADTLFDEAVALAQRCALWDRLEQCHGRLIQVTIDSEGRQALHYRLAEILSEADQGGRAMGALEEAHRAQPLREETFERLAAMADVHGEWDRLAEFYGAQASETESLPRRISLIRKQAAILEDQLKRPSDALEQLVVAFQLDPDDEAVEASLFEYAGKHDGWPVVIKLFEVMAKERDERALRRRLLEELARIHREVLDEPQRAFDYVARAWRLEPSASSLRRQLVAAAEACGRLDGLADAYEWEAANRESSAERVEAWLRLGDLCLGELSDPERGVRAYGAAYEQVPDRVQTIEALEQRLQQAGLQDLYLPTLAQWVPIARTPSQRADLFRRIGRAADEAKLHDEAVEAYRGVLSNDPTDMDALRRLAELHREAEDWDRVIRCLEQLVRNEDEVARWLEVHREIADLHVRQERYSEAIEVLEQSAERHPTHSETLDDLVALYQYTGKIESGVDLLERAANHVKGEDEAGFMLAAARLAFLGLGDDRRATRVVTRLLRVNPEHRDALRLTADIAESAGRWKDVADAWLKLAASASPEADPSLYTQLLENYLDGLHPGFEDVPPPEEAGLCLALGAAVMERRLLYREKAVEGWQRAAEAAPEWAIPPLALARMAAQSKQWESALDHTRNAIRLIEVTRSQHALGATLLSLAVLQEQARLPDLERFATFRRAFLAVPGLDDARLGLARVARALGRGEEAVAVYGRVLDRELEGSERQAVLVSQAQVLASLDRSAEAAALWDEVLRLKDGDAPDVQIAVAKAALDRGQAERALGLYQAMAAMVGDAPLDAEVHRGFARAAEQQGDISLAQEHYTQVYARDPNDVDALLGLARIAIDREAAALANQYLEDARETLSGDGETELEIRRLRADVLNLRGERGQAIALLESLASEAGPVGARSLSRLAELQHAAGDNGAAAISLRTLTQRLPSGPERTAVLLRLARLGGDDMPASEDAWAALSEAFAAAPGNADVVRAVLPMALELERYREAADMARTAIARFDDDPILLLAYRTSTLASMARSEWPQTLPDAFEWMQRDPFSVDALEASLRAATALTEFEALHAHLAAQLETVGDARPAMRARLQRELAQLLAGPLDRTVEALELFDELAVSFPHDTDILEARFDLGAESGSANPWALADIARRLALQGNLSLKRLRFLQRAFAEQGENDPAYVLTALLATAREADDDELERLRRADRETPRAQGTPLPPAIFETHLRSSPVNPAVLERFRVCATAAAALSGPIEAPLHPLSSEFAAVAQWMDLGAVSAYESAAVRKTTVMNGAPTAVVFANADLANESDVVQRFELAYWAALMRPEMIMTSALDEFRYVGFHEAALEPLLKADGGFGRDETMAGWVRDWRLVFGEPPDGHPDHGRTGSLQREAVPSPADWIDAARSTALRVALLWCDSVEAGVEHLVASRTSLPAMGSGGDLRRAVKDSPEVAEAVGFLLSDAFWELRERLGTGRTSFDLLGELEDDEDVRLDETSVADFELAIDRERLVPEVNSAETPVAGAMAVESPPTESDGAATTPPNEQSDAAPSEAPEVSEEPGQQDDITE